LPPAPCIAFPSLLKPRLDIAAIEAVELEFYAKQIPDLIFREDAIYRLLKNNAKRTVSSRIIGTPLVVSAVDDIRKEITLESPAWRPLS
jgi:hypothetical protein